MPPKKTTKAPARGRRKSIVDEYKAKARGKKTSTKNEKKKPVKRKPMPRTVPDKILQMTIGEETYSAGDLAYYVMEAPQFSKRVHTGDIKCCHPKDNVAPCVTVWDHQFGNYRVIRAALIGWSKAEAKKKWQSFIKENPQPDK